MRALSTLNSVLWDKHISKTNKHRINNAIVKSIVSYSSQVWQLKDETIITREPTEIDFWRSSAGTSRIKRVTNNREREKMEVHRTITGNKPKTTEIAQSHTKNG